MLFNFGLWIETNISAVPVGCMPKVYQYVRNDFGTLRKGSLVKEKALLYGSTRAFVFFLIFVHAKRATRLFRDTRGTKSAYLRETCAPQGCPHFLHLG